MMLLTAKPFAKDMLLHDKTWPFTMQKHTFCIEKWQLLQKHLEFLK